MKRMQKVYTIEKVGDDCYSYVFSSKALTIKIFNRLEVLGIISDDYYIGMSDIKEKIPDSLIYVCGIYNPKNGNIFFSGGIPSKHSWYDNGLFYTHIKFNCNRKKMETSVIKNYNIYKKQKN